MVWLFSESVEETSSNVKMKTRIKSFQSTILTRKEKNAFQDTTDVMAGQIYLSTRIRKDFFQIFLGMTVRMEVMKMIVISVTSKSTKSLCELELCLNFK